ncbi:MAG: hypothetical protein GY760_12990 [Deltaproteobacteria bacterium]|nr:hypothetical protein [Deltaproteobacteria bacterium]
MIDVSVSYNKYKFLGNEFLTWLWFIIENEEINLKDHEHVVLEIGNKIVCERASGDDSVENITIKGDDAGLEEGKLALKKGAVVTEISVVYKSGEHQWKFTIKGESLNLSNLKTPETESLKKKDEYEGAILEKYYLYNKIVDFIDKIYKKFVEIRLSKKWDEDTLINITDWIKS